jgi:deazaflavin-dependent oxidoreductase (nitroreductase family)
MSKSSHSDPAERRPLLRLFYRDWQPTRIGRWVTRFTSWLTDLGLAPKTMATLEVRGRTSGQPRSTPVVIATVAGESYLVSMLGPDSDWVKNVVAAHGDAVLQQGRRRLSVHLVEVPPLDRAPILSEYVRVATSGRHHIPVAVGAPLSEFEAVAERYPAYRIDPV